MEVIAKLRYARISPRKARYIRPIVVNKEAEFAMSILENTPNKAATIVKKLIKSALANARQKNPDQTKWYVKNLYVNEGPKMKRLRAAPMGRAVLIMKRLSHITVVLEELSEIETIEGKEHGAKSKSNRT
ncbi:MAG: 50S ribosomal protein L22 [Candidatus Omnitrophica bacterium]|nr:50S ribosomal protein L22 [Candidatus Omnitrophota bacterium]